MLDDVDLNTYGSRGQQRLAVLALKLAEADWMRDQIGELPVVLLDDMLSELDPQRRGYVLQRVADLTRSTNARCGSRPPRPPIRRASPTNSHRFLDCAQRFLIDAGRVGRHNPAA